MIAAVKPWRANQRFSLTGVAVIDVIETNLLQLPRLFETNRLSNNGPEFTGRRLDAWAYDKRVELRFIEPGRFRHRTPSSRASTESSETNVSTSTGSSPWRTPSPSSKLGAMITTRARPSQLAREI